MAAVSGPIQGGAEAGFLGGAQKRNLAPPGVAAALAPANTTVSSPDQGVGNGGLPIKRARPNEGSNVGLPYARVVPLTQNNALLAPDDDAPGMGYGQRKHITETEHLNEMTLAFILGVRSSGALIDKNGNALGSSRGTQDRTALGGAGPIYNGQAVGFHLAAAPGVGGPNRVQFLCSFEYLQAYFAQVVAGQTLSLSQTLEAAKYALVVPEHSTGALGQYGAAQTLADSLGLAADAQGRPPPLSDSTFLRVADVAKRVALPGADVAGEAESMQGIFCRDLGPFLKGRGGRTALAHLTRANLTQSVNVGGRTVNVPPRCLSRNAGDDLAFGMLYQHLCKMGALDWLPDGIVLSKAVNDPSDKTSDEFLDARDGALYNLRVQGPALASSWAGESTLACLPGDTVFVALVCDVWYDDAGVTTLTSVAERDAYMAKRAAALNEPWDEEGFKRDGNIMFKTPEGINGQKDPDKTKLTNLRVVLTTSAQLVGHSAYKGQPKGKGLAPGAKQLPGGSRLGLAICNEFGEYLVGAHAIGTVLDSNASRAGMPRGANLGPRTAPNSAAMNVNVNIGWHSADQLCRKYNNADGAIAARHQVKPEPGSERAVNAQLSSAAEFEARKVANNEA